ncbi:epithelial-stromal interaction protein 1 isoform X2 [Cygnus olor]|uniref:epithelial-stromal interaction protein 1 isoform X2 n=1 Tax=Cygnus olor TaxID=8869 RepID=UPI001ADE1FBC|nr:epithelial-stromal interaction protein 1 isoform X2 [Cygnus olor]
MEGRQQVQDGCCLQYPIFLSGLQQSTRGGWKTPAADDIWRGAKVPSISLPSAARAAVSRKEPSVSSYVLITPNETRRNQLQQIAKKELDDLERWKEEHRPRPIKLIPQRLGGKDSEAEARQKQQMMLVQSKYQQKHKREEYMKAKKAAEEAEILKKKAIQREKAERLEVKKRQQEMQRREMFLEEQYYKTNELLNRLDLGLPKSDSCQIANRGPESTAWAQLKESKQKQEEEARTRALQNEQRRVNNAFLDRLQNKAQTNSICQPGYSGSLDYLSNGAWGSNYLE